MTQPVDDGAVEMIDPAPSFAADEGNLRLDRLRRELRRRRLAGFVIPRADAHQGEYVAPSEERLRWLTGFSGSAGTAGVFAETAALFVDGRYTLQAPAQTDTLSLIHI